MRSAMRAPVETERLAALAALRDVRRSPDRGPPARGGGDLARGAGRVRGATRPRSGAAENVASRLRKEARAHERLRAPTVAQTERHQDAVNKARARIDELEESVRECASDARADRAGARRGRADARRRVLCASRRTRSPPRARPPRAGLAAGPGLALDDRLRSLDAVERLEVPAVATWLGGDRRPVEDRRVRLRAVALRGRPARSGTLADALALLAAPSWPLVTSAVEALRTLHAPEAIPPLIALLGRDDLGRLRSACRGPAVAHGRDARPLRGALGRVVGRARARRSRPRGRSHAAAALWRRRRT